MRILEALSALELIAASAPLLWRGRAERWLCAVYMGSCALLALQALVEGAHWQILPLYLAAVALAITLFSRLRSSARMLRISASLVMLLVLAACCFSYVLPMFPLPRPTGPFAVGTRVMYLTDESRAEMHAGAPRGRRELMIQLWYPAQSARGSLAPYRRWPETTLVSSYMAVLKTHSHLNAEVAKKGAPFPVLLFNPAWKGQRTQNTFQMEDLASHGFVVVAIDHPYNSQIIAFPDGRRLDARSAPELTDFAGSTLDEQLAVGDREVEIEARDTIFVLDQLARRNGTPGDAFWGRLNTERAGAFGHSFGGAVSMEAAFLDSRIQGALNLDGWMYGRVATAGLAKPYLLISNDAPDPTPADLASPDRVHRLYAQLIQRDNQNIAHTMDANGGMNLVVAGCNHFNFSDRALYSPLRRLTYAGSIQPQRAHEIVEAYTRAFFLHLLSGKFQPLLSAASSPYPEVQVKTYLGRSAGPMD